MGLYALIYRIPAKMMKSPQVQTVQYRPFETNEAIIWKPQVASIVPIVRIASTFFWDDRGDRDDRDDHMETKLSEFFRDVI